MATAVSDHQNYYNGNANRESEASGCHAESLDEQQDYSEGE